MTLSILVIDDHPLMSAALVGVLQTLRPRTTCSVAHSGATARQALAQNPFHLIVLDLALPDTNGFELLSNLQELYPETPVLVVSASENAEDMRRVVAAGAKGFVPKSAPPELMLKAATMALRGEVYLPEIALASSARTDPTSGHGDDPLTPRQIDVLRLVCAGRSNKFIAYELGLAEKTVKGRITAIFRALDVDNRTQAVLKAAKLGLFPMDGHAAQNSAPTGSDSIDEQVSE